MIPSHPLAEHSTATVSDALDRLGRPGSLLGIAPLFDGARLCGRAFTVRYVAAGSPAGTVGDYLDDVTPDQVVVLDNSGRTDCTVWGDILTAMATARNVSGTVIDGVCRDVDRALGLRYPIYSRGRFMRTGKDRVEVSDVGRPVTVGGVQVRAGDLMIGDSDGVVAVPADVEDEVLRICTEISAREAAIVADVLSGTSLAEARRRHGYHLLQRQGGDTVTAEFLELGTATLYEASGLPCFLDPGLRPAWPGATVLGRALPVRTAPGDNLPLHLALEQAQPGDVLVVDAGGVPHGYWGEVLTVAAQVRGVRGLVIDGGVRDTHRLQALGFGVFSRWIALAGTAKNDPGTVGALIPVGDVTVARGDLVVGDADGVVVLPAGRVDDILVAARDRTRTEAAYLDRLRSGESTVDIYGFRSPHR